MRSWSILAAVALLAFVPFLTTPALAAPTPEQRAEIAALGTLMTKAGNLFTEKLYKEAGEVVKDAQSRLEKLAADADSQTLTQIATLHKRLSVAHARLKTEGITLPELKALPEPKPAAKATEPTPATKTAPTAKTSPTAKTATPPAKSAAKAAKGAPAATVSFVKDVAPVLNVRCGGCHVRNARGQFSMATFEGLMKGPMTSGKVVFPGDAKGSVLIEKIEAKEMPPSGAGIPDAELATLKKWIEEGAKFDGPSPTAELTSYVSASSSPAAAPAMTVQRATGKETVSFASDIAPVLVKSCIGCHGNDQPRSNFSLTTMTNLIRGGDRGEPILPGKAADSFIIKKLKGTAEGARMPQRAPALDPAIIAKFETWINEGARFDGSDARMPLAEVAAIAKAQSQTHEQLTKDRADLARENWRKGMPDIQPSKFESTNYLVLGSVGENTLADIAKKAEALAPKVGDILKAPANQPLVKGRVTLFVFGNRYDYGEFGKMVEKRDLPAEWRGHYRFSIVDAYGSVMAPKTDEYDLDALIAQQLGAVYAASWGKEVPHWFAEGCGRVVATRIAPAGDRRVMQWDSELSGLASALTKPDDFMTGKLNAEMADVCSFSFVKFLMTDTGKFTKLMDALRKGGDFKKAFTDAYGAAPEAATAAWIRNPPKVGRLKGGK